VGTTAVPIFDHGWNWLRGLDGAGLTHTRLRAVKLYLKYGRRLKATIRELGYPTKNSLKAWCAEFEEGGELQEKYVRSLPKYSAEQKNTAIEHYVNHGRCFALVLSH
jgi:transposase-like protein